MKRTLEREREREIEIPGTVHSFGRNTQARTHRLHTGTNPYHCISSFMKKDNELILIFNYKIGKIN